MPSSQYKSLKTPQMMTVFFYTDESVVCGKWCEWSFTVNSSDRIVKEVSCIFTADIALMMETKADDKNESIMSDSVNMLRKLQAGSS